jgi:hypothetical protein
MSGIEGFSDFLTPKQVKDILNRDSKLIERSLQARDNKPMETEINESMKLIGVVDSLSEKPWTKTITLESPDEDIYKGGPVVAGVIVPVQHDNRAHLAIFKTGDILLLKPRGVEMAEVRSNNQEERDPDSEQEDEEATTLVAYRGEDHMEDAGDIYRSVLSPDGNPFGTKIEASTGSVMEDISIIARQFEQVFSFIGVSHKNANADDVPVIDKLLNSMYEIGPETLDYMKKAKRVTRQTLFDASEKHEAKDSSQPDSASDEEPEDGSGKK